jgi:hypothetical protein
MPPLAALGLLAAEKTPGYFKRWCWCAKLVSQHPWKLLMLPGAVCLPGEFWVAADACAEARNLRL